MRFSEAIVAAIQSGRKKYSNSRVGIFFQWNGDGENRGLNIYEKKTGMLCGKLDFSYPDYFDIEWSEYKHKETLNREQAMQAYLDGKTIFNIENEIDVLYPDVAYMEKEETRFFLENSEFYIEE